ncbi:MAG: methylenetetrahydrofolate reductase [NAD(P)H] [Nitrospirae bacterium]|nr:methylenetetrahydrofolate reductase [NAD(P)H] [Nitrospirota bacterium]
MNRNITDIFKEKEKTYSFEFFPPKTQEGISKLYETAAELNKLGPDFVSVTYGAGGLTRGATLEICLEIQKRFDLACMHHLTCVGHSRSELKAILDQIKQGNVRNVLAMRGDAPKGAEKWQPAPDGLEYSYQLCDLIKKTHGSFFSIGVAGFPEGHINCPSKELDSQYLKTKIDHGGEFVVTQLFFDNSIYFEYLDRTKKAGVNVRIIPGILPITSYQGLIKFCSTCGATIPQKVHDIFSPIDGNDEATYKAGVEFAVKQCQELIDNGAPGIHFFTLNKLNPTKEIFQRLKR